jgi:hypothetical protein
MGGVAGMVMKAFNFNIREKIDPSSVCGFFDASATKVDGEVLQMRELKGRKAFLIWVVGCD